MQSRRNPPTTCLEVDNDSHKLSVYYFRTNDSNKDVIAFLEAPLGRSHHSGVSPSHIEERDERRREDGSDEFLFSYLLWQRSDLAGFVGYREELKPKKDQ
jgi:hypothetical protein